MKIRSSGKTSWGGVRIGAKVLCMLGMVAGSAVWANPKLLMDATKLLAEGNPKQAYMILVAEQNKLAGNLEFDYLLGVAALDSGRPSEAIIAFERVLAMNPMHAGAMMDLGRAYFTAGSLDLAESAFKQLQVSNPPEAAKMAIERYLKAIAERRSAGVRRSAAWGEQWLFYLFAFVPTFVPLLLLILTLLQPTGIMLSILLGYCALSGTIAWDLNRRYLQRATPAWALPLLVLMYFLLPLHTLWALLAPRRINWRGHIMAVQKDGGFSFVERR